MIELEEYPDSGDAGAKLAWVRDVETDSLVNTEKFGQIFDDFLEVLRSFQNFIGDIDTLQISYLSNQWSLNINAELHSIQTAIHHARAFHDSANVGNFPQQCKDIIQDNFRAIVKKLSPFAVMVKSKSGTSTLPESVEVTVGKIEEIAKNVEEKRAQVDQALESVTASVSKSGVAKEATHFSKESQEHAANSKKWLRGVATISTVILLTAACFYFNPPLKTEGVAWNYFIPRFSILGLLVYINFVLVGIYRAERHNAVVNKHRANALNTFETMTAATLTQDVKDAVTLTAAGAIYAPQDTGYSKKTANSLNSAADILSAIGKEKE